MNKLQISVLVIAFLALGINAYSANMQPIPEDDCYSLALNGQEVFNTCEMLGAGITTIQSTDTLKDSRSVINTNFSNLNTMKLESSDFTGAEGITYTATGTFSFDCSEVEGTGINCSGEDITLDATGDWTGTLDSIDGSDIFQLSVWFATTSAPHLTTLSNLSITESQISDFGTYLSASSTNLTLSGYGWITNIIGTLTGNVTGDLTGNADTATALAANGANCAAGSYPLGVDASGAVEDCTDATTEIDSAISTHAGDNDAHHALVTLAGQDYLTLSTQEITAGEIEPDDLASSDFGDFTCNGTNCSLDETYLTASTTDASFTNGIWTDSIWPESTGTTTISGGVVFQNTAGTHGFYFLYGTATNTLVSF